MKMIVPTTLINLLIAKEAVLSDDIVVRDG